MLVLEKATISDIPEIARLAHIIWNEHYPSIIGETQTRYMLDKMYSAESLTKQITSNQHQFYLIRNNDLNSGFVSVSPIKEDSWMIHKFYIVSEERGIGTQVFEKLIKELNPEEIRLTVNRNNYKSINFYFKNGFKIEKPECFDIGNGFIMDDFVMLWKRQR